MTTTMSIRERREKMDELVQNNPRVQTCANTFNEAQAHVSQWHEHNDALCATNGALNERDDLLTYSEAALDALNRAKTTAYNQLMDQYPRVWDTSCDDPFNTGTQDSTTEAGAETEEMEEVPADTECPRIPLAEVKSILTKWETDYKEFRDFLAGRGLNPDGAGCAIFAIKEIRDDINKLTTTKEDKEHNNTNCGTFINWDNCPPGLDFDLASKKLLVSLHAEQELGIAAGRKSVTGKEFQKFLARSEEAHKDFVESALEIMYRILLKYPGYHKVAEKLDFGGNNQTDMDSETTELGDEAKEAPNA